MMWLVVWTAFKCPWWMPSTVPPQVKPMLCRRQENAKQFSDWPPAHKILQEAGPDFQPKLFRVNGDTLEWVPTNFVTVLEITEAP